MIPSSKFCSDISDGLRPPSSGWIQKSNPQDGGLRSFETSEQTFKTRCVPPLPQKTPLDQQFLLYLFTRIHNTVL